MDYYYVVVYEFERHGWQVIDVYLCNPMCLLMRNTF